MLRAEKFLNFHTMPSSAKAKLSKWSKWSLFFVFGRMLKELKAPQSDSNAWCSQSDRLQMAEDTLSAVRRVRREVVDSMRMLMKAAKDKKSDGMFAIIEEMLRKTKCLCR